MGRILTNANQSYRRSARTFNSFNFAGFRYSLIPCLSHTTARYKICGYALFHQSNISFESNTFGCCIVCVRLQQKYFKVGDNVGLGGSLRMHNDVSCWFEEKVNYLLVPKIICITVFVGFKQP